MLTHFFFHLLVTEAHKITYNVFYVEPLTNCADFSASPFLLFFSFFFLKIS